MFALLPIVGGLLLGWLVPRKTAVLTQIVYLALAVVGLTLGAQRHDARYVDSLWIPPALAVVSAGTLLLGFWLRQRSARQSSTPTDHAA